jgi:hypothetical protein
MSKVTENLPQYLSAGRNVTQKIPLGSTWANKIIKMDNIVNYEGIDYNIESGTIRLQQGNAYRITAQIGIRGSGEKSASFYLAFGLFTSDGVQIGPLAETLQVGLKSSNASGGLLDVIHTPTKTGDYYLKMSPDVKADSTIVLCNAGALLNIVQIMPGADVLSLRRFTNQTISPGTKWANKIIVLSLSKETTNNVGYNSSTGEFTLQGGKTYRITAQLGWRASSPGWYAFGLFDSKDTQIGPAAESLSSNLNTPNASGAVLDVIHTPYTTGNFRLRMKSGVTADSSSSIRADVSTFLNIVSIPKEKSYVSARLFVDKPYAPELWRSICDINMRIHEKWGTIKYSPDSGNFRLLGGKKYRITAQVSMQPTIPDCYSLYVMATGNDHDNQFLLQSIAVSPTFIDFETNSCAVYDVIVSTLHDIDCIFMLYSYKAEINDATITSKIRADMSTFMNIVEL